MDTPRIRMFAGPNGAGKSTLIRKLQSLEVLKPVMLGIYINPDDMEGEIRETGALNLTKFDLSGQSACDLMRYLSASEFLASLGETSVSKKISSVP